MKYVLLAVVACLVPAARRILGVAAVVGASMQPTFNPGDRVLYRRTRHVHPGQVVVLDTSRLDRLVPAAAGCAARSPKLMIKRVVAVAGDPWPEGVPPNGRDVVESGRLVVLGDSVRSLDSRQWGSIPVEVVHGVALRAMTGSGRQT